MPLLRCHRWIIPIVVYGHLFISAVAYAADLAPAYDKEVRPILSQYCFKCHGPDDAQRQAGLRLDSKAAATAKLESGQHAIVAGNVTASELIKRINSADPDERMPPASTKMVLSDAQKQTLTRWIAGGAEFTAHWSFVAPRRQVPPPVAATRNGPQIDSPIDAFIAARLQRENLSFSPEADKYTLSRRVSLDLIGLPPTVEETDRHVEDGRPDAFERYVDRLLASPHYGERWARKWLDLARYADTNGYEKDRPRTIWPYRDWVINALNVDLPFDQFSIEQLAGDMLPHASIDQRIATGFHRNTMLNEEGGIDPLEFRFYAMTDRVATTATAWLGLTLGCAQCHTHKYDPITHRDYYSFFALLNNADEPEMEIVSPELVTKRANLQQRIEALESDLPNRFPLPDEFEWQSPPPASMKSTSGANLRLQADGSILVTGETPETDDYEIQFDTKLDNINAIRLTALSDPQLPSKGPGRTPHGNFVLSEIIATVGDSTVAVTSRPLKFDRAVADFSQNGFPIQNAIDGDVSSKAGWAIDTGKGNLNVDRTATFYLAAANSPASGSRWSIRLVQQYAGRHVLGKFRLSFGRKREINQPERELRQAHLRQKFDQWRQQQRARIAKWTQLTPVVAVSTLPLLTILPDGSILASGDQSKREVYDLQYKNDLANITALRIEVLPDPSLPRGGPGRVSYEGPFGDFFLSEVSLSANQQPLKLVHASHSFADGMGAPACLDGNQQTGWSINGGQGKPHTAVFRFEKPIPNAARLDLSLLFERYYAAGLGRFRVSVTDDLRPIEASQVPTELESLVLSEATDESSLAPLVRYFCSIAPEMAGERGAIDELRKQMSQATLTLVMNERPANNPRPTHRHHRGEFLQPKELVTPAGLSMLPPLPADHTANRLELARWLVGSQNPLTARVIVNRHWAALFGRGIVRSTEDFGSQGASPTHPELLDWLALELSQGASSKDHRDPEAWSIKRLHRRLVGSTTYRQSSRVSADLLAKDSVNELLARGPRFRLDAELVRDLTLRSSGLLSEKMGGASVYPAQPSSVTTEGTYGSLPWTISPGEDRYRRSLYTFSKRTSPFAMFMTFDGPSGEACIARREVTNTPLQALTMLNDTVVMEAAQRLGNEYAIRPEATELKLRDLFRRCLTRPPTADELSLVGHFLADQTGRFERGELDAKAIAGPGERPVLRAAWTLVARSLLNLDETITKE